MVDLETAVTDRGTPADKPFAFRAPASTLPALEDAGVDVVSLADDHGLDVGRQGLLASTKRGDRLVDEVRRARADADTVVAHLHWGEERNPCPLPRQQELAQQLVDAGADVGGHAHVQLGGGMLDEAHVD